MMNMIGSIFWVLLALAAIGQSTKDSRTRTVESLPDDHDVALYQNVLESQLRRMDGIDAILSATGLLVFTAMTYLFSLDGIKDGPLTARVIALRCSSRLPARSSPSSLFPVARHRILRRSITFCGRMIEKSPLTRPVRCSSRRF